MTMAGLSPVLFLVFNQLVESAAGSAASTQSEDRTITSAHKTAQDEDRNDDHNPGANRNEAAT